MAEIMGYRRRATWVVLEEAPRVVAALSEDMKPDHLPYGFPWELVMCTALGFFAVLSLFWRGFQSVRSRLYVGREKRLALNLAGLTEAKCGLLEKVSLVEKEHEGLESSLKDCRFEKGSREAQQLEATDEKLHRSESSHGVEMLFLEEELKAQKAQHGQQDETMAHLSRRIQSLQGESESLRSQIAEGFPWELVMCTAVGFFAVLSLFWRGFQSVHSRLYVGREKRLTLNLAGLTEAKCGLLEKVSLVEKEHEGLESSLKDCRFEKGSREAQQQEATDEKLHRSESSHGVEMLFLEEELKAQKAQHGQQDETMAHLSRRIQSLQGESESLRSQIAEAKTNWRLFQVNEEELKLAIKEVLNEGSLLPQTQTNIQGEAEAQREQGGVLYKAKIILEDSKVDGEQVLRDTENQIESLSECLLKMKDRSSPSLGAQRDGGHLELGKTSEPEIGAHLEDESKGALRNLVYGDKVKASLEILEGGRNQKCTFSSEVEKTTEDLTEHLKSLQTEQASLQSENAQLQSENETLQKNFKVMMERYQENMMKLHRKLRVEENYRVEQEEKLSKVEEKMSHTIKELETYRKRAQYLEEQLQSTIRSCLRKIISSEKEAHASELAAQIAERNLSYFRKQNAHNRQKLTEKELRFELVEKDPYDALDVSNSAMGRKPSPNGPSPIGHPSSERRPPHFEKSGPLTLSPFTPVGGGRGSRGPGNPLDHATSSKARESSCHKFTDFQRAPSQTGPLSPPGEQASRLMIPPPGQPYSSDARLPLQRQDRFYSNCGRASGPAEHRIPNMPPLDSDVPDSPLHAENQATGSGSVLAPFPPSRENSI
ncbi:LOW QUALITY PROTEIN: cTAGE family member 2-like [Callospermophilus lateralis]